MTDETQVVEWREAMQRLLNGETLQRLLNGETLQAASNEGCSVMNYRIVGNTLQVEVDCGWQPSQADVCELEEAIWALLPKPESKSHDRNVPTEPGWYDYQRDGDGTWTKALVWARDDEEWCSTPDHPDVLLRLCRGRFSDRRPDPGPDSEKKCTCQETWPKRLEMRAQLTELNRLLLGVTKWADECITSLE